MREIKFRAWDGKKMWDVQALDWHTNSGATERRPSHVLVSTNPPKFGTSTEDVLQKDGAMADAYELMQYTGLHDKNGKEIYEGDVVVVPNFYYDPSEGDNPNLIKTVSVGHGNYELVDENKLVEPLGDYWDDDDVCPDVEIVGNIHEHPDLLK